MKIGLIGNTLLNSNPAGVEKYTFQLYNALAKIDSENFYTIYLTKKPTKEYWNELTNHNPNFDYKVIEPKPGILNSWTQILLKKELQKNPRDVVFYPNDTITGLLTFNKNKNFKAVSMIHDLSYQNYNEYKNPVKKLIHYNTIGFVIKNSKKIIVPSYFVKEKILSSYGLIKGHLNEQDKIEVIPEGLNKNFENLSKITDKQIQEVKNLYKINDKKYLYAISTIQPRKNYLNMIKAFSLVVKENPIYKDIVLAISGKPGWDYDNVYSEPKNLGIKDNVLFLNNTPDEHVAILLKGAFGYVNVSFEEGFGLPVLEAMHSQKPLLISNINAFKELVKENAVYVEPQNLESIKLGMLKIICNKYPYHFIKNAYNLSKNYNWLSTAQKTIKIFESVYFKKT